MRMQGFDPFILCPICFGPEGEREKRRSLLRQVINSWTKPPCFICDNNGEVQASVAEERLVIDVPSEPKLPRLAPPSRQQTQYALND